MSSNKSFNDLDLLDIQDLASEGFKKFFVLLSFRYYFSFVVVILLDTLVVAAKNPHPFGIDEASFSTGKPKTLKDYDHELKSLKEENFNLKIRIYLLEEEKEKQRIEQEQQAAAVAAVVRSSNPVIGDFLSSGDSNDQHQRGRKRAVYDSDGLNSTRGDDDGVLLGSSMDDDNSDADDEESRKTGKPANSNVNDSRLVEYETLNRLVSIYANHLNYKLKN